MIAPQRFLYMDITTRTSRGTCVEPLLICLFLFIHRNQFENIIFAEPSLDEHPRRTILWKSQVVQNQLFGVRDRARCVWSMPGERTNEEPSMRRKPPLYQVRLQKAQKENEHAGHNLNRSQPVPSSESLGLRTGVWQKAIGQWMIEGSGMRC